MWKNVTVSSSLLLSAVALGGELVPPSDLEGYFANREASAAYASDVVHYLNELTARRRLTTVFPNEQSPFYGVQMNYVNVGTGNLTFLVRDLVRPDRLPIVFGRVYDSRKADHSDFGPGWKLCVSEFLRFVGSDLWYVDSSNSEYELHTDGSGIWSEHPHLTGVSRGSLSAAQAVLRVGELTKTFQRFGDRFQLTEVRDDFDNWIRLSYAGDVIDRISSSGGRHVDIERDAARRIVRAVDDAGRTIHHTYDSSGRLIESRDLAGEAFGYAYNADGFLTAIVDPRDAVVIAARYDENGRVVQVSSQHDTVAFAWDAGSTLATNAMQQAAQFWHHETGLTETARDFAGALSALEFDGELHIRQLLFQGTPVASADYEQGRVSRVITRQGDGLKTRRLLYDAQGRLIRIGEAGSTLAKYAYDAQGRIVAADDVGGQRRYRYGPRGDLTNVEVDGFRVALRTNEVGLVEQLQWNSNRRAGSRHSTQHRTQPDADSDPLVRRRLNVVYDQIGRVESLLFQSPERSLRSDFRYGARGFREGGRYDLFEGMDQEEIALSYDAVGNLVEWTYPWPDRTVHRVRHTVGPQNQALAVTPLGHESFAHDIEYDASGRPVRATEGGRREAEFAYDDLGRLTDVYLDGQHLLTASHGPMDVDPVLEGDAHSPFTTINRPVASAVFGSIDEIVFTRTVGTPYGFVKFVPTMARFVLADPLFSPSDSAILASLGRRNFTSAAALSPLPLLGLDKPSNSSFIPPEYFAVNCVVCYGGASGFTLTRIGSGLVNTGDTVNFVADATSSYCYYEEYFGEDVGWWTWAQPFTHEISVNGNYQTTHYSWNTVDISDPYDGEYLEFGLSFSTPGTKIIQDTLRCEQGCGNNIFLAQAQRTVQVCQPPLPTIIGEYQTYGVNLNPACSDFTQTRASAFFQFGELNTGDYTWALVRDPLVAAAASGYGLDRFRQAYGAPRIINSAYRNPVRNFSGPVGGAPQSRHMYGDAADVRNQSGSQIEWNDMVAAGQNSAADFIEPITGPCGLDCVHVDWRAHAGDYSP